ncbi:hypothetical protein EVAR_16425_1 [Eumeta japonica]|uniref:Uncharacterized protein n=1 Tax=Eumeta variegata TaxID=151549 RepID=A0A4C1UK90_EUMVA|nr:hypothetical protein EVAR_16425_1 [Eumeta japonica]
MIIKARFLEYIKTEFCGANQKIKTYALNEVGSGVRYLVYITEHGRIMGPTTQPDLVMRSCEMEKAEAANESANSIVNHAVCDFIIISAAIWNIPSDLRDGNDCVSINGRKVPGSIPTPEYDTSSWK